MTTRERKIGEAALQAMGKVPNLIKCVEELAELQQALCKYLVEPSEDARDSVHEELADAGIMLNRMLLIFDAAEVEDWKDAKLEAMERRLGL